MTRSLAEFRNFFTKFLSADTFKEEEIKLRKQEGKEGKKAAEEARESLGIESGF